MNSDAYRHTQKQSEAPRAEEYRRLVELTVALSRAERTVPFMSPRFMRIFEVRPGYPLFLVPFITVFGVTWGLWIASVVVTVAGGVLAFLILRTLRASLPLALTGFGFQ